tara:strand:- start:1179 stop:1331 length:153 start_codon:yes stop_codon:yes gene_type:complete
MSKLAQLVGEIEATLECEKKTYDDGMKTDDVVKGWIEALDYVLEVVKRLY